MPLLSRRPSGPRRPVADRILAAVLAAALAGAPAARAQSAEYQVKAAFLYNFAKFVEWPPGPATARADELRLCVFGEDPFGDDLDALAEGKAVQNKWLRVARVSTLDDVQQCQVVFISSIDIGDLAPILRKAHDAHALTVGESHEFVSQGGIISFVMEGNKVRFEINTASAERANLRISSQLLKLAARVINNPVAVEQ